MEHTLQIALVFFNLRQHAWILFHSAGRSESFSGRADCVSSGWVATNFWWPAVFEGLVSLRPSGACIWLVMKAAYPRLAAFFFWGAAACFAGIDLCGVFGAARGERGCPTAYCSKDILPAAINWGALLAFYFGSRH